LKVVGLLILLVQIRGQHSKNFKEESNMCGIVGVARFGELNNTDTLRASALYLATSLLEVTEKRGKDATGVSALFDDGNFFGQKMGVAATEFIARYGGKPDDFDGLLTVLREYEAPLRLFIGHCRKKSAGSLSNVDNHPIKVGNILGIHNGTLKNHDEIFKNLKCGRDGEVDSEAIFRLMQYYTKDCKEPFTLDLIEEVCRRLEGSFSILAFNANNPNQLVSAKDGRPAEYCLIKPLKLVLIASEKKFFESAIWSYNKLSWLHNVGNFTKLKESDVEFASLADDTIALFDLTQEITENTELKSLYETRPIPKAIARIWKTEVKTTSYNTSTYTGYGNNYSHNKTNNQTAASTNSATDDKEDKKSDSKTSTTTKVTAQATQASSSIGRVWNTKLNKYVKIFGKKEETRSTSILKPEKKLKLSLFDAVIENEVDALATGNNELKVVDNNKSKNDKKKITTNTPQLVEHRSSNEDYQVGIKIPIVITTPIVAEKKTTHSSTQVASVSKETLLKDMKMGAAAGMEKALEYSTTLKQAAEAIKDISKFENAYEVADLMEIEVGSLQQLPIAAFANRLISAVFTNIFTTGWKAKKKNDETNSNSLVKNPEERISKAQKHIRVLKTISKHMGYIIDDTITQKQIKNWFKLLQDSLIKEEVNSTTLTEIFNAGDFRSNKPLKSMIEVLQSK